MTLPAPLFGAQAKLDRADENICNLEREVLAFLNPDSGTALADVNQDEPEKAFTAHANRVVPLRFSILAGEITHELRTCLDHIAWALSSDEKRTRDAEGIGFPVYVSKPAKKGSAVAYDRKVEGISICGRELIESLQPYHRTPAMLTGPESDPLAIIHDLDIIDKHRHIVLVIPGFAIDPEEVGGLPMLYRQAELPEADIAALAKSLNPDCQVTPEVAFAEFGGWKVKPLIPGLKKLANAVRDTLLVFARECF